MDYSGLLTRAWNTVWNNKFLIVLGMLVALGSGGGGGNGGSRSSGSQPGGGGVYPPDFCERGFGQIFRNFGVEETMIVGVVALIVVGVALIGFILWSISRVAEGGLISGVNEIDSERSSSFAVAWSAGWAKVWQLIGIGLVTAVPGILLMVILGVVFYQFFAGTDWRTMCLAATSNNPADLSAAFRQTSSLWIVIASVSCLFAVGGAVLEAIRAFADRACMLENTGVLESYGRGWAVMSANFGEVVLLFLIQIVIGIALAVLLFVPGTIATACCFCIMWPVVWAVSGGIKAYFSTLWTLAWRQWTGGVSPASASLG